MTQVRLFSALLLICTGTVGTSPAYARAIPTVASCQHAVARESANYVRSVTRTVDRCLANMSARVVQKELPLEVAAAAVAEDCRRAFARLANTGAASELGVRFHVKVAQQCHAPEISALGTDAVGRYCMEFGGDGTVDSFSEWLTCLRAAADAEAREAIATRWPRALEWFEALEASMEPGSALSALVAIDEAIEGNLEDNKPDFATSTGLVATGARDCVGEPAEILSACPKGPEGQDGIIQAGYQVQYTDNGDGTITDHVTGLVWEKLGDDGSIHDQHGSYTIEEAVGVKIAALNSGDGFAGHADWRLPNRRELESLVDSGDFGPSIDSEFRDDCTPGCSANECSCTLPEAYWTSTVYVPDPSKAWIVDFLRGMLDGLPGTDTAHVRAVRGGARIASTSASPRAARTGSASLAACQRTLAAASMRYVRATVNAVGHCLNRISAKVIDDGATLADAARAATSVCIASLQKISNTADPEKQLASKFDARVASRCDPSRNPDLGHVDADTWTIGDRTLAAANLNAYCVGFGGDGSIDEFSEWQQCMGAAADRQVRQAISLRWPRALEYFAALAAELSTAPESTRTDDAIAALAELDRALEGATDDNLPEPPPAPPSGLLETGQTECVQADHSMGPCPGGRPGQDGEMRAGVERRYVDNGDGTISDLVTGLMWQKQSFDDSITDFSHTYYQQGAHWNILTRMNRYAYAGYSDWRLPNRRELESLVDAGRSNPAIDPIFHHDCVPGCNVLECSCTASAGYRSSTYTPLPDVFNAIGAQVYFDDGSVSVTRLSGDRVRLVRAGHAPSNPPQNQPPETFDVSMNWGAPPYSPEVRVDFYGWDPDSPWGFVEIVDPPTYGILVSTLFRLRFDGTHIDANLQASSISGSSANTPVSPSAGIPVVSDTGPAWCPYDMHSPSRMSNAEIPDGRSGWTERWEYLPFSTTWEGVDSATFRIRDVEGKASNVALLSITYFRVDF